MLIKQTPKLNCVSHKVNIFAIGLIAASALAVTMPAQAAPSQVERVEVRIDPYDLQSERGIARVYKRLQTKAESACTTSGLQPLAQVRASKACTQALLAEFVEDLGHDGLSQYHTQMTAKRA